MKKYKHYKGKVYEVLGEAVHSETDEKMVIYKDSTGEIYVRPAEMFYEEIIVEGIKIKRFEEM